MCEKYFITGQNFCKKYKVLIRQKGRFRVLEMTVSLLLIAHFTSESRFSVPIFLRTFGYILNKYSYL